MTRTAGNRQARNRIAMNRAAGSRSPAAGVNHEMTAVLVVVVVNVAQKEVRGFVIEIADLVVVLVIANRLHIKAILMIVFDVADLIVDFGDFALEIERLGVALIVDLQALIVERHALFDLQTLVVSVFPAIDRSYRCAGDARDAERQATDAKAK
jgi:hypothetical protein